MISNKHNYTLGLLLLTQSIYTKQLPGHVGVNELLLGVIEQFVLTTHGIANTDFNCTWTYITLNCL